MENCKKYDLKIMGCSRQTEPFQESICVECSQEEIKEISTLLSPEDIPFVNRWSNFRIIAAAYPKRRGKEYICIRCRKIYFDNINPDRDILCHQCTLDLAMGCEREEERDEQPLNPKPKEDITDGKSTKKFRPLMDRKRPLSKVRS